MIKEYIVELREEEAEELMDEHWVGELVRYKYCKRRGTYQCPIYVGGDGMRGSPDDWFCADGEKCQEGERDAEKRTHD